MKSVGCFIADRSIQELSPALLSLDTL
jgi:hypothetical protein